MAFVRVEQRNAHLAGSVRLDWVQGRDGKIARATLIAISNTRRGSGEQREEEAASIRWTAWGKQAENAAEYLGKGSHVNIVGRLRNNHYQGADGAEVYGLNYWRWQCPTFLRQTFVEWAAQTINKSFWAGAFYRQQRDKGSSHQAAVRALAFKWLRILYRCWQTRTPYDESTYLNALKKRGSPLLNQLNTQT